MRSSVALLATLVVILPGCLQLGFSRPQSSDARLADPEALVTLLPGVRWTVRVPVCVLLVGFPPEIVRATSDALTPEFVDHAWQTYPLSLSSTPPRRASSESRPLSYALEAAFRVHAMAVEDETKLQQALGAWRTPGSGTRVYRADLLEAWLDDRRPKAPECRQPGLPMLVALFLEEADHELRYTYPNGWVQGGRAFGENHRLLGFDLSARPDSYVQPGGPDAPGVQRYRPEPYDRIVSRSGPETVHALERLARDAAHFRILQGPLYPPSLRPCHAITIVLAVRATSVMETGVVSPRVPPIDAEALHRSFENVTGPGSVRLDVVVQRLPVDDPILDAVMRGGLNTPREVREWLALNWHRYWIPHAGCQAYLSLAVLGDVADVWAGGIALADVDQDRRISFSVLGDLRRFQDSYAGPGREILGTRAVGRDQPDWINLLLAHETGHLIGLRHPHDIEHSAGPIEVSGSFASVWSAMSYRPEDRTRDLSRIDEVNFQRARALGAFVEAQSTGPSNEVLARARVELEAANWWGSFALLAGDGESVAASSGSGSTRGS